MTCLQALKCIPVSRPQLAPRHRPITVHARMQRIADGEALCDGCSVEFLLAAGPAEALRPLGAVASGGETARVMMALKAAPAFVLADSGAALEGQLPAVFPALPSFLATTA